LTEHDIDISVQSLRPVLQQAVTTLWRQCLLLLQDDDEDIRSRATNLVSIALVPKMVRLTNSNLTISKHAIVVGITRAQEIIFQFFTNYLIKYNPQEYVNYLISFIHVTDAEVFAIKPMTLEAEALFEVEKDNFYAETTVYTQMAASQLCLLLKSEWSTSVLTLMANWRSRLAKLVPVVLRELPHVLNESRKIIPRTLFPLFSPQCFQALYKLLLGLLLTKSVFTEEALEEDITNGIVKLKEFPGVHHPVLSTLLHTISDNTQPETNISHLLFLTSNSAQ